MTRRSHDVCRPHPPPELPGEHPRSYGALRRVFGGDLEITTWGQFPSGSERELRGDLVLASRLTVSPGFEILASDTSADAPYHPGDAFTLAVTYDADSRAMAFGWWEGLVDGGSIAEPLEEVPWGARFGRVTDRFGVHWVFNIDAPR